MLRNSLFAKHSERERDLIKPKLFGWDVYQQRNIEPVLLHSELQTNTHTYLLKNALTANTKYFN